MKKAETVKIVFSFLKIVITKFKKFYSIKLSNINVLKFTTFQTIVTKTFFRVLVMTHE